MSVFLFAFISFHSFSFLCFNTYLCAFHFLWYGDVHVALCLLLSSSPFKWSLIIVSLLLFPLCNNNSDNKVPLLVWFVFAHASGFTVACAHVESIFICFAHKQQCALRESEKRVSEQVIDERNQYFLISFFFSFPFCFYFRKRKGEHTTTSTTTCFHNDTIASFLLF